MWASTDWTEETEHNIVLVMIISHRWNTHLHTILISLQETYLSSLTWHWFASNWRDSLLLLPSFYRLYHLSLNTSRQMLVNQTVLLYLNADPAVATRNASELFESRHIIISLHRWSCARHKILMYYFACSNQSWYQFLLFFWRGRGVSPFHLLLLLPALRNRLLSIQRPVSKHTCADITQAACGLTSVCSLEPYLKGKWAPVISVAAW